MGKYAIIIVSVIIFSVITYSHGLRNALFLSNTRVVQSYSQNQAHNIAQSAAMMAINNLRNDSNSNFLPATDNIIHFPSATGFELWEELSGSYNLRFTNQGDSLLIMNSTGRFEETIYRTTLGLLVGPSKWNPNLDQALHAEHIINLTGGSGDLIIGQVSINSISENSVRLGSQSKIKIAGDLLIGPGGDKNDVIVGNMNNISGNVGNLSKRFTYDMPIFPDFPTMAMPAIYQGETQLEPHQYSNHYFTEFNLQGSNNLVINTGDQDRILHVGKLNVQSSDITIIGDGKLTIYVEYGLDVKGNAKINKGGVIDQLMIYYKGNPEVDLYDETLSFGGSTQIIGSLYADKASINLNGTASVEGHVLTGGNNVTVRGNPNLESEFSRVIFAPNGRVEAQGNVHIKGAVIADTYYGSGNSTLEYDPNFGGELPDLELPTGGFDIAFWN
ncbi:MAG: hypothetical protein EA359_17640 [Balneolaceae bacterium]|nr:MAG: hypothetical protein EA359_17640 [Balneolaceae bacterium]